MISWGSNRGHFTGWVVRRWGLILGMMLMITAWAGAQESPAEVIRSRNTAINSALKAAGDPIPPATTERLKDLINGFIDFDELAKRALGRHWDDRTEVERKEFTAVFRDLVRNSSVKKLEAYQADRIEYQPATITGSTAKVTTMAYKGTKSVTIIYDMHKVGNQWLAWDVTIDGASTVRNYRDSFGREISRGSYKAMYEKLLRRVNEP